MLCSVIRCCKGISLVSKYTPMEVIFNGDLLVMKIKITYLILSPIVICYFWPILIFDLDHFFGDLPYLWRHDSLHQSNDLFILNLIYIDQQIPRFYPSTLENHGIWPTLPAWLLNKVGNRLSSTPTAVVIIIMHYSKLRLLDCHCEL